jgi:hypothetical protein
MKTIRKHKSKQGNIGKGKEGVGESEQDKSLEHIYIRKITMKPIKCCVKWWREGFREYTGGGELV